MKQKINYDCPFCDCMHGVYIKYNQEEMEIKGEIIEYESIQYYCDKEDGYFTPSKIFDANILRAKDMYRLKHNLLTSSQIKEIRELYGLSQVEYSQILGFGERTIHRYETKQIQDIAYDNLMKITKENPSYILELLMNNNNLFSTERLEIIKNKIKVQIRENLNKYFVTRELKNLYIDYDIPSIANGNKILDIEKIIAVINMFALYTDFLYKVKLMKMLWYTDIEFYKNNNSSITGLVYEHKKFGALPIGHREILNLPFINVNEEIKGDNVIYKIEPNPNYNSFKILSIEEIGVIQKVIEKFKNFNSSEIINYMHEEDAYIQTSDEEIIPFSYCKSLKSI